MIVSASTPVPASVGVITVTQWRMRASTTMLKIVKDRGFPCATSWYPLNKHLKYPPELSTIVSWSHYVQRSWSVLGPTPVRCENLKAYVPIQGIICLLDVRENLEENHLPHGCKLLEQLGLEGGGIYPTARLKPVKHIVECDG